MMKRSRSSNQALLKIPERNVYKLLDYIEKYKLDPRTIIELGARDCTETIVMSSYIPNAHIYTFECNPNTLPICRTVCKQLKNVTLVEKAVTTKDGSVTFFAIDQTRTKTTWKDGNPGASSLLQASGKYPVEKYAQKEVTVVATKLNTFLSKNKLKDVDVLWMDIQGSELKALKSLGAKIKDVQLIHTEVEFFEIYKDQPLFNDIFSFLNKNGFYLAGFTSFGNYSADAVFINRGRVRTLFAKAIHARRQHKLLKQVATIHANQ